MKKFSQKAFGMTLLLSILSILFSCSSDSDLLLESVLNDPEISLEDEKSTENLTETEDTFVTRTFTFSPTNDAYIQNDQGHNRDIIRLEEGHRTSYLMFDLSDVNGIIIDAELQFSIDSDEGDGAINFHKGGSADWTEETLSKNNAPSLNNWLASINKTYKVGSAEKVVLDANSLSAEVTTIVMSHSSGNDLAFASKEHPANKGPKLVITYQAPEGSPLINQNENNAPQEENTNTETNTTTEVNTSNEQNTSTEENSNTQENTNNEQNTNTEENTTTEENVTTEENTSTNESATNQENTSNSDDIYYVTTNGRASNNGLSESNSWSIEHAFEMAAAGDVIFIKAGNYGAISLDVDNSGTLNNPIKFVGYTNIPGDLASNVGPTFNYGESLNSNKMPLIRKEKGEYGIRINENYVEIENFQVSRFRTGISANGSNLVLRNIIAVDFGTQTNYDSYDGFGIHVYGNNALVENCYVQNATAEAIKLFGSSNSRVNNCKVYANNPSNPTDYYFLITGNTKNSVIENSYAERASGLKHGGHGFDLKDQAEYNVVRNCTAKRTSFELNFSGVRNNTFTDNFIYGQDTSAANWQARVLVANGANNNLIKNMLIQDTWSAISFSDYDDGYVGPGGDRDEVSMGNDNTFENITIKNTERIINAGAGNFTGAKAERISFVNCNFSDFNSVAIIYFPMENTLFKNCNFKNGNKLFVEAKSYSNFGVNWENCTWTNVNFSSPN